MKHIKFGSIGQFKNVIKEVRETAKWDNSPVPTITFTGSVKNHGSNHSIAYDLRTDEYWLQSRERIITPEDDNAGAAKFSVENIKVFNEIYHKVANLIDVSDHDNLVIYMEFCGGNIQSGVALNQLPKHFVIFNITLVKGEEKTELTIPQMKEVVSETEFVKLIYNYKTYKIEIDFNKPELSQNQLVEWVQEVENECPYAKAFGAIGIGEGAVFASEDFGHRFKVKGRLHSESKVKTIVAVDTERLNSINELVDTILTENRLNQGLDKLREQDLEIDMGNTGAYLKWVVYDSLTEEADTVEASGFDKKEIGKYLSDKAKKFWFSVV